MYYFLQQNKNNDNDNENNEYNGKIMEYMKIIN